MKRNIHLLLMLLLTLPAFAATGLKGVVVDAMTGAPIADANVMLRDQGAFVVTAEDGSFTITEAKAGNDVLQVVAYGYLDIMEDVNIIAGLTTNLGEIKMQISSYDTSLMNPDDYIFDESQLLEDEGGNQSIGTIQGANDNVFYQTANYDFSVMRFRMRGYDSEYSQGYINGVNFNDPARGRFNFSGLGGMTSTAFRSKSVGVGLESVAYGFGGIGGSHNFSTYAADYAPGWRGNVSYTNSNYMLRAMMQYATGVNKHGWALTASVIGRYAPEGVTEGTFYNSVGYFLSLQKIFNDEHSINITTWGAPTQRATASATYEEAYQLAGNNLYNPNWGWHDGKKKSARIVNSFDPSAIINWIWKPQMGTTVNTAVGFRHNKYASSALNWYQAADPRPDYYRYLPSYYEPTAEEGTELYNQQKAVYDYYTELWQNNESMRQIDWAAIYQTNLLNNIQNQSNPELRGHATYIIENRHSDFTSWMFNSYINHRINDIMTLDGGVSFNYTDSHYYKTIKDLLGAEYWRDIDNFSERDFPDNPTMLQNDLNNPNRKVTEGDVFGYDYNIRSITARAWLQNQIKTQHWDVNYGMQVSYTNFRRYGNMRNGRAPENSYGAGERHTFDNVAFKAGATYKLDGRNYFVAHASYGTAAPLYDYAYVSPRVKDTAISGLQSERYISADISYVWNYSRFRGSITGFWTNTYDGTERTSFYDDQHSSFMNYVMAGVNKTYKGVELGMAYKITPSLTVTAAGTFSRYQYTNRPRGVRSYENGTMPDTVTTVYIKNYYVAGTPQQAYNIGIDWAAPKMWFFNINASWMGDSYIDLSPIRHEALPDLYKICNSEEELEQKMREIATQERLNDAFVVNLSIGKVIYTKFGQVNFNLSVNNLLNNKNIQTGGYQQGRFDYDNFDVGKFPNKIYYAQGIRIFLNCGIRF